MYRKFGGGEEDQVEAPAGKQLDPLAVERDETALGQAVEAHAESRPCIDSVYDQIERQTLGKPCVDWTVSTRRVYREHLGAPSGALRMTK